MSRPDLDPTQPIPTLADDDAYAGTPAWPTPPHHRSAVRALLSRLRTLVLLLFIVCGAIIAVGLLLTPTREAVLLLGSDARPDELARGQVGRTDTLMLLVADRAMPREALISVPRDLWVAIPGYTQDRINAAYELGGPQTAKQTVSNVLGQRVDRYLLIGLQGVRDIVDAAGGVDITVPTAIHDDAYPTDNYGYMTVDIPAGRQHMDGETALEYARTRHQDNDFARTARQQQVLGAVRNQLLNPVNWPRLPAVLVAVQRSIKTDVSPLDAIAIGAAMLRNPGDPDRLVIDTALATETTGADGAYLLQPKPTLRSEVARFLNGAPNVSVEVLNGTGTSGLASRTAARLSQAGFLIAGIGDATQRQTQTTILARPSARAAADQVASALGLPSSRIGESASLATADIQVVLGADAH